MKDKENHTSLNWHFISVLLIFAVLILLMVLYMPTLREIDSALLESVKKALPPFFQYLPAIVAELTRNYYLLPLTVSGGILVSHKYYLETFLLIFFTQATHPITQVLKDVVCRQRPAGVDYPGYSFPSHHALTASCLYGILIFLVIKHTYGFWRYFLVTILSLLIIITALSRLVLGVHFPTDVLEGILFGLIMVNMFIILDRFFDKR